MFFRGQFLCDECLNDDIETKDKENPFDILNLSTGCTNLGDAQDEIESGQLRVNGRKWNNEKIRKYK